MAPQPLRVALAAVLGLLGGSPLAGASRVVVGERADAVAGEAEKLQPLRAWTAAAAAEWHGAAPPLKGLAAPLVGPTLPGDVRTPRQRRVVQNLFAKRGDVAGGGVDKDETARGNNAWPEDAGVAQINAYAEEAFSGVLRCSWTPAKGRILRATRSFAPGEQIFVEAPLLVVEEQAGNAAFERLQEVCRQRADAFEYAPLYYWCAIQSLTKGQLKDAHAGCTGTTPEVQDKLLLLHHEHELKEPSAAAEILAEQLTPCADVIAIERLLQVWLLNCFAFSQTPLAFSTYYFSSFMSHSCLPNAVWGFSGKSHVLRSQREIKEGDEVCISYLKASTLMQSAPERRLEIHTSWDFWCDCERCRPGGKDLSRGVACPECGEGKIFAKTPVAGPAEDASLLPSQWAGACCDKCGYAMPTAQGGKLAEYEREAQEVLDASSGGWARDVDELERNEVFIDQHFAQHVLGDLVRKQLGWSYAQDGRAEDMVRLLERRAEFHKQAYPGLNPARAQVLEALGDSLEILRAESAERANGVDRESTRRYYTEAREIRRLLFGEDDVVVRRIDSNLAKLE